MNTLADDLLIGAGPIAQFMFGDVRHARRIYHLKKQLPLFYIGNLLAARKSTLTQHMAAVERGVATIEAPPQPKPKPVQRHRRRRTGPALEVAPDNA